MNFGSVCIIDALGFKGIWERVEPNQVITKLRQQAQNVILDREVFLKTFPQAEDFHVIPSVSSLSDTVVLAVQVVPFVSLLLPGDKQIPELAQLDDAYRSIQLFIALKQCAFFAATAVADGLMIEPPLAYRGAIASGEFMMDDRFFVGPAIDEAGTHFEQSEGAFVFLAPSATGLFHRAQAAKKVLQAADSAKFDYLTELVQLEPFGAFDVPLKNQAILPSYALDPMFALPADIRDGEIGRLLKTFDNDPKGATKSGNTRNLLRSFGYEI